jgi:hypothetical protein
LSWLNAPYLARRQHRVDIISGSERLSKGQFPHLDLTIENIRAKLTSPDDEISFSMADSYGSTLAVYNAPMRQDALCLLPDDGNQAYKFGQSRQAVCRQ